MTNPELALNLFLQLAFILFVIRVIGRGARLIGQPQVVGEMIAGIMMGPSLFGLVFPETQAALFPKESVSIIYCLSQIGILFYMFIVGVEFNSKLFAGNYKEALSISLAGIIVPFTLGGLLGLNYGLNTQMFMPHVRPWEAALFTGAAMAITAFPVLARIIYERGLSGTRLGTLVLSAGAVDDAAAWCLLALVLSTSQHNPNLILLAVGGTALFVFAVLKIVKPRLIKMEEEAQVHGAMSVASLSTVLILLMLSAYYTDYVGIHAVFGGFILGLAMPRGIVAKDLQNSIEPVTTNFFLPLFFIYSGLNTRVNIFVDSSLILSLITVIAVACIGKGLACYGAARMCGLSNREALGIGTLMNTRGMMELILLNIGLQKGLISVSFFTIMVIMAIVTTMMTDPIFNLFCTPEEKARSRSNVVTLNFKRRKDSEEDTNLKKVN